MSFEAGFKLKQYMGDVEKEWIQKALEASGGVREKAALLLGMNRTTLLMKMRKYGFPPRVKHS